VVGLLSFPRFAELLVSKLKALKYDLKIWNEDVFENVERKKKTLLQELHVLDVREEKGL
jgi:hypothetical protein